MRIQKIKIEDTNCFSGLFTDYLKQRDELKAFHSHFPFVENIKHFFTEFDDVNRQVLNESLGRQHQTLELSEKQELNISLLQDKNTFTVTTGHQLNIFCGPLYFIYKIITTIKACEQLKAHYPNKDFVPIYWMASEDHDFEEISYFHLFNQKHTWHTQQKGAVGRMHTEEINAVFEELKDIPELFDAYREDVSLAEATRKIVHQLFKDYGLLILDADDVALKREFKTVIKDELTTQKSVELINQQTDKLTNLGYKGQVYPRAINLFYLKNDLRARIEKTDNGYSAVGTNLTWSEKEMLDLAEQHPEQFSPNVALRPIYQQVILPNVAYIGGPGELAYWLQLSDTFTYHKATFPSLMPRNFGLFINKGLNKKMEKLNLSVSDLFKPTYELKVDFIKKQGAEFDLVDEKRRIELILEVLVEKVSLIDGSLKATVASEMKKIDKQLSTIEKKVKKAQENKYENEINQLINLKERLFPNGGLQERRDNFLNFYINDKQFIDKLYQAFEPFDYQFHTIIDE